MSKTVESTTKYELPLKEIKTDLLKTFAFAVFAVVLLAILHFTGVSLPQVKEILSGIKF